MAGGGGTAPFTSCVQQWVKYSKTGEYLAKDWNAFKYSQASDKFHMLTI